MASGFDLDAEHPGENAPEKAPNAANGARLWQQIDGRAAAEVAASLDLRHNSPSDVHARLVSPDLPEGKALAALAPAELWDVVAYLWRASTTPEALQLGAQLYKRDCTGCHGLICSATGASSYLLGGFMASRHLFIER